MMKPHFGDLEGSYEIVNNTRILQPSFLPKAHKGVHDMQLS